MGAATVVDDVDLPRSCPEHIPSGTHAACGPCAGVRVAHRRAQLLASRLDRSREVVDRVGQRVQDFDRVPMREGRLQQRLTTQPKVDLNLGERIGRLTFDVVSALGHLLTVPRTSAPSRGQRRSAVPVKAAS